MTMKTLHNALIVLAVILFSLPALAQDATETVTEEAATPVLTDGEREFIDGLGCEADESCVTVSIQDLLDAGADSVPNPEPILDPQSFETLVWAAVWIVGAIVLGWVFTKWGDVFVMALNAAKEGAPQWVIEAAENSAAEALQTLDTTITGRVNATTSPLDNLAYEPVREMVLKILNEINAPQNVARDIDVQIFRDQEGKQGE